MEDRALIDAKKFYEQNYQNIIFSAAENDSRNLTILFEIILYLYSILNTIFILHFMVGKAFCLP